MAKFYNLSIKDIKKETEKAVSIAFDIPQSLKKEFEFIPGQYITLKKEINNQEVRRAYSICSSPKSGEVRVVIKEIENGTFSVYANTNLQIEDSLDVSKPEGKFVLQVNPNNQKNYLSFAAGSGITPIMSMIQAVLEEEPDSNFVMVYGNKTIKDTIFYNDLNALLKKYPNRFYVQYVFSQEQPEGSLFGRIDKSVVNFTINKHKNFTFDDVYLCGPESMINTVQETLQTNDFDKNKIHFELFTANTESNNEATSLQGESKITIVLDDEEVSFTMSQKETILDAALKKQLDAPYSCQGGVCSSCIAKVTEGKAVMDKNTILSKDEVDEGLVLTCQAHPVTNKIIVDFDDV